MPSQIVSLLVGMPDSPERGYGRWHSQVQEREARLRSTRRNNAVSVPSLASRHIRSDPQRVGVPAYYSGMASGDQGLTAARRWYASRIGKRVEAAAPGDSGMSGPACGVLWSSSWPGGSYGACGLACYCGGGSRSYR
jgi:hypothetical protein